jgi:hypothetical protein
MGVLDRRDFSGGWQPDADPIGGPATALLRADNLILDERGALTLRPGATKINDVALADHDVHSLFTAMLSGTRYRMVGAGNEVYANGGALTGVSGSGDVAFGSGFGDILIARGGTKLKYNGSLRSWGIGVAGGPPTFTVVTADTTVLMTGDAGESPAVGAADYELQDLIDLVPLSWVDGHEGTADGAVQASPGARYHKAGVYKYFDANVDLTTLDGGTKTGDDSVLSFWIFVGNVAALESVQLVIPVNDDWAGDGMIFENDYYYYQWDNSLYTGYIVHAVPAPPSVVTFHPGWNELTCRRGGPAAALDHMQHKFLTAGKDWSTVRAIKIVAIVHGGAENPVAFDDLRMSGGPVTDGEVTWKYVYAAVSDTTITLSAPSAASGSTALRSQGAIVTVPADASRNNQITEVWLYRQTLGLGDYYRVATAAVSGTGAVEFATQLSDEDALSLNIRLEPDNHPPPDDILGIAGPYFDRIFTLTASGLHPSRRRTVDTFAASQEIRLGGNEETAYWIKQSLGGLYIGTSRDIYLLEGDGAELPDGSMNFLIRPLNVDHAPINDGVGQDGNLLIYCADDGWRAMAGAGSESLTGVTSLLYRGKTRHGVSPVNLTGGRFRAAVAKGQLVCLTPEGASTANTPVLYRQVGRGGPWYRHTYTPTFRCVYREPDGTLIASDTSGFVWMLDNGTTDAGAAIPVTLWMRVDHDGEPFVRKDPLDLRLLLDTGNVAAVAALHLDNNGAAALTLAPTANGLSIAVFDLVSLPAFTHVQLRLTVTTGVFRLETFALSYKTLPRPFLGRTPESNAGYGGEKVLGGLQLRLCARGAVRTLTPYLDGVALTPFTVVTATDEPDTHIHQFTATQTGTDLSFSVDGDIELYEWEPIVLYQLPVRLKVWENIPLVRSAVRRRFGGLTLQIDTHGATALVTPVLDGVDQTPLPVVSTNWQAAVRSFPAIVGRDLWCRVTSATPFVVSAVEPLITETLPQLFRGRTPWTIFNDPRVKTLLGFQLRLCTFGVPVTVTPYVNGGVSGGTALASQTVTTARDDPSEFTFDFPATVEAQDMALYVDGNVELYAWTPMASATRPLGVLVWDSGPIDLGNRELVWLRHLFLKVRAGADLTITPWFDGRRFPPVVGTVIPDADTIVPVDIGRAYWGRLPRLVVTSTRPFHPYWIKVQFRNTGQGSKLPTQTVPVTLGPGLGA